ncbi:MAG: lipopolysaccharide biosynthesis protein [Novosphingobium sp.]
MTSQANDDDIRALAKGGKTNVLGFILRLAGRIPFLFIAGRLYGPDAMGRFAFALAVVEFAVQLCTLGQKRGLAQELAREERHPAHVVADGMLLSAVLAAAVGIILYLVPIVVFPSGQHTELERLIPAMMVPMVLTDIALSAQAYRFDVATTVRSRAIVEPWVLSILAAALWFVVPDSGLILAYIGSVFAAAVTALWPVVRTYGLPRNWHPHPLLLGQLAIANLPLAIADAIEWGTRRLDVMILGVFASPTAVGVYYAVQQIASIPQKFKTSFDPVLGPVITRNLKDGNHLAISQQVRQVGYWIIATQIGVALALGITGEGVMGLTGPEFVPGAGALIVLLAAEVIASTAAVSEAALIYVNRVQNMLVSLATLGLQIVFSVVLILLARRIGLNEYYWAAAVAGGLGLALGFSSIAKSWLLGRFLDQPTNPWRVGLVWGLGPAALLGWFFTRLTPEWAELALGIPVILVVYAFGIWHKGFGPEDRVLFRKNVGG